MCFYFFMLRQLFVPVVSSCIYTRVFSQHRVKRSQLKLRSNFQNIKSFYSTEKSTATKIKDKETLVKEDAQWETVSFFFQNEH